MAKTIAALLHGRDNNFNLIRFTAASAVLLDHSFALVAQGHAAGDLIDMERLEIGRLAVDVFFIVSGFLVTRSVLTQPTLVDYAVARFLRLFPALLVATIGIAFVLGPLVTSVSWQDYFSDPRPWLYVPLTASLITHSLTLPGVFDTVPEAGVIDAPLWTLRYETMCYVLLALFAGLGMLATRTRAGLTLALILAVYVIVTFATPWRGEYAAIDSAMRFVLGFFVGGALYLYADKIRLSFGVALLLGVAAFAAYGTPIYEMVAQGRARLWADLVCAGACRSAQALQPDRRLFLRTLHPLLSHPADLRDAPSRHRALGAVLLQLSGRARSRHSIMAFRRASGAQSRKAWAGDCVGSLLHGVRQRLAASLRSAAAAKVLK